MKSASIEVITKLPVTGDVVHPEGIIDTRWCKGVPFNRARTHSGIAVTPEAVKIGKVVIHPPQPKGRKKVGEPARPPEEFSLCWTNCRVRPYCGAFNKLPEAVIARLVPVDNN